MCRNMRGTALGAAVLLVGAPACATLFSSGDVAVSMGTEPSGAEVWVDGTRRGVTPLTLEVDNTKPHTVTFKMAGRQDQTVELRTSTRAGFVILDILGGLLPVIIDAATGEWKTVGPKTVNVNLLPAS